MNRNEPSPHSSLRNQGDVDYTHRSRQDTTASGLEIEENEDWEDRLPGWCCLAEPIRFRRKQCMISCSCLSGLMIFLMFSITTLFSFQFVKEMKMKEITGYYRNRKISTNEQGLYVLNLTSTQQSVCKHYKCKDNYNESNDGLQTVTLNNTELKVFRCCLSGVAAITPLNEGSGKGHKVEWSRCEGIIGVHKRHLKKKCTENVNITRLIPVDFGTKINNGRGFNALISYRSNLTPWFYALAWGKHYISYAWFILSTEMFWLFSCLIVVRIAGPPTHKDVQTWLQNITLVSSLFILQYLVKLLQYLPQKQDTHAYCGYDSTVSLSDSSQILKKWECDDVRWLNVMNIWMEDLFSAAVWCFTGSFGLFFLLLFAFICRACWNTIPESNPLSIYRRKCWSNFEEQCCCECCYRCLCCCCRISRSASEAAIDLGDTWRPRPSSEIDRQNTETMTRPFRTFSEAVSQRALSEISNAPEYRISPKQWMMGVMLTVLVWANYLFGLLMFVTVVANAIYIGITVTKKRSDIVRDRSENTLIEVVTVGMANALLAATLTGVTLMRQRKRLMQMCIGIVCCSPVNCARAVTVEDDSKRDSVDEKEADVFVHDAPVSGQIEKRDSKYTIPSYSNRRNSGVDLVGQQPVSYQALPVSDHRDSLGGLTPVIHDQALV